MTGTLAHSSSRFAVLDAWRGLCACLVTLVHIPIAHSFYADTWFTNMQLFVDFFFVLSGFVICHAYGTRVSSGRGVGGFMIRRFGRIWPLHAVVLAGFVAFELAKIAVEGALNMSFDGAAFSGNRSLPTLLSNIFLVQSFNLHGMTSWNGPAWSIGAEFYTYAVFALAVFAWGARPRVFAALALLGLAGVFYGSETWLFTTHDYGFFRCLFGFFTGCLVHGLVTRGAPRWVLARVTEFAVIALLVVFIVSTGRTPSSLLAPLIFAALVYVFAFEAGPVSKLLKMGWAQALGLWSYSIYMIHMLLFAPLKVALTLAVKVSVLGVTLAVAEPVKMWTFGHAGLDALAVMVALALPVALAQVTYAWVEQPARDWFSKRAAEFEQRSQTVAGAGVPQLIA